MPLFSAKPLFNQHFQTNKVPVVTALFWLIRMLSTTVGESGADYPIFNLHLGLNLTAVLMGLLLVVALTFQQKNQRYVPYL